MTTELEIPFSEPLDWNEDAPAEPGPFVIDSETKAEWVVDKINVFHERQARLDAQYQAMKEALANEKEAFENRFLGELEQWAIANPPRKGKSLKLLTGTIGWRRVNGGPRVRDKSTAIDWALTFLPESVTSETVHKLDTDAIKVHVATTGELPPGVEVIDDEERFYVKGAKDI